VGVGLSDITKAIELVPAKPRFVVVDACGNVAFTKGLKDAACAHRLMTSADSGT